MTQTPCHFVTPVTLAEIRALLKLFCEESMLAGQAMSLCAVSLRL